jgi:MoaA/NifB/PqqE/SkfB family radical SAM enzyme
MTQCGGEKETDMSDVGNELKKLGLLSVYNYLEKDPEKNLPEIMKWFDQNVDPSVLPTQRKVFRDIIRKGDSQWYDLLLSIWTDIDEDVRKKLFENILINANVEAAPRAKENREKYHCNIPWALSLELNDDNEKPGMDFDDWDDVIEQAKALGTFSFILTGGDPLVTDEELIALCNKHNECAFFIVTSGERIDDKFCQEALRVGNIVVVLDVKADEDEAALKAKTDILRKYRLAFIAACFYNKENQEAFMKEEFFDMLIRNGVKLSFFISDTSMKDDRFYRYQVKYRMTKPMYSINFCKDSDLIGGCVAGGRYYCHINAEGDVEPCFFKHESDTNIKDKPLIEALQSPAFMKYSTEQFKCPFLSE